MKFINIPKLKAFQHFVSTNFNILNKIPALTIQQALNEPSESPLYLAASKK